MLNELINGILAETKKQENKRKEYISLIHNLINSLERTTTNCEGMSCTWRLSFRWHSSNNNKIVHFSQIIVNREAYKHNEKIMLYDKKEIEISNHDIDKCINYMLDCGDSTIDSFIEHISKVAIPQFLLGRFPKDYRIH